MKLSNLAHQWRIKGLLQFVLALAPGGEAINDLLQTKFGALNDFEQAVTLKVDDWTGIMSLLKAAGRPAIDGKTLLEIGTGWHPTLPFCFLLGGAAKVHTVDLNRHMNAQLTFKMRDLLRLHLDRITRVSGQPAAAVNERYSHLAGALELDRMLASIGADYLAPCDAACVPAVPDRSVDIVYSNSVLEHVHPNTLPQLMRESHRILKDDGIIVHAVACNDHYAHFDRSISFVNYLQYSDRRWLLWNNRIQYQNRLRAPDFTECAEQCGFRILHEARAVRPGTLEAAARMTLAPRFRQYSSDDLAATSLNFVASKALG